MPAQAQSRSPIGPNARLSELEPLNRLSEAHFKQVTDAARLQKLPPETSLCAKEEHRWFIYLLDGVMSLQPQSGNPMELIAGSDNAVQGVFDQPNPINQVVTRSPCVIIRVERQMVSVLEKQQQSSATVVHEIDVDDGAEDLFAHIYQDYVDRKLKLPSMPEIAMKIREVIQNEDLGIADVARVVSADPTLAVRIT
ncbi:MAG: HDOD domain-containing protein, partial [Pseudomonadota bacterium]